MQINSGAWILLCTSDFNLLGYVAFVEENLASHRLGVGRKSSLLQLTRYLLTLHQNSTSGIFLEASCSAEFEAISMSLPYSILHYKQVSPALFLALLSMCDSVTSCLGHLENSASLSYADISSVYTVHGTATTTKFHLLISSLISSKKGFKYWEVGKLVA